MSGAAVQRMLPLALFGTAGLLLGAGLAWPSLTLAGRQEGTRAAAATLLQRAVAAERAWALAHRGAAALPAGSPAPLEGSHLVLTPDEAASFLVDALPEPDGALRVRVISRPEAIRDGRAWPLLLSATLPVPALPKAPAGAEPPR